METTTNVKTYRATIVGLEETEKYSNIMYIAVSNIEEKNEEGKYAPVSSLPQYDKDGGLTYVKSFSKGYKCLMELVASTSWGKLLSAKTLGRPYLYENSNTILSLLLNGATIRFERQLLHEGDDNPNMPGSKVSRDMYFTAIKAIALDTKSINELSGFIKDELANLKKKEVTASEITVPMIEE